MQGDCHPNQIKRSQKEYEKAIVGIASTQPAIVIEGGRIVAMGNWKGQNTTLKPAIALAGRVPVKVSTENGPIMKGDLLTSSSKPGYAMKCGLMEPTGKNSLEELNKIVFNNERCRNSIIGKVLEPLRKGEGEILALANYNKIGYISLSTGICNYYAARWKTGCSLLAAGKVKLCVLIFFG